LELKKRVKNSGEEEKEILQFLKKG